MVYSQARLEKEDFITYVDKADKNYGNMTTSDTVLDTSVNFSDQFDKGFTREILHKDVLLPHRFPHFSSICIAFFLNALPLPSWSVLVFFSCCCPWSLSLRSYLFMIRLYMTKTFQPTSFCFGLGFSSPIKLLFNSSLSFASLLIFQM